MAVPQPRQRGSLMRFCFFLGRKGERKKVGVERSERENSFLSLSLSQTQKLKNSNTLTSAKIVGSSPYLRPVMLFTLLARADTCCR